MRFFKIIIFLGFFSAFLLNAESNTCPPKKITKADEDKKNSMKMYNSPARVDTNGWDFFIKGDFLYWQPLEEATDLGYLNRTSSSYELDDNNESVEAMDKDFKPAFKVAIGTGFDYDNWCLAAKYLFFHSTQKQTLKNPNTDLYNIINYWAAIYEEDTNSIYGKWKLDMDIVDISLSRPCFVGKKLTLSPNLALNFGRINQRYKTYESDHVDFWFFNYDLTRYSKSKSKSWLIGPKFGIEADWLLGSGFSIKNNIFASLNYQSFKLDYKEKSASGSSESFQQVTKRRVHQIFPTLEIFAGLNWGSYFCENDFHVDLALGYDFVFYANQNYMFSLVDANAKANYKPFAGDLFLHGLSTSVRFDF